MSANAAADAPAKEKPKKKLLVIVIAAVVLLVVAGGGAFFFLSKKGHGDEAEEHVAETKPKAPPTFLAIENMVVNLADPGGERFAQVGITLELADAKTEEQVKSYMPSIRSAVLMLISQRTADDLLQREGKEKLAADILAEVSRPLGYEVKVPKKKKPVAEDDEEDEAPKKPRAKAAAGPVRAVLFSSFIIQ